MKKRIAPALGAAGLQCLLAFALVLWPAVQATAQNTSEIYTATVIPSEGMPGASGRISIRIASYTSEAEKTELTQAFKKNNEDGVALLRTMSKGYVNIEGQPGRKIEAAFSRDNQNGYEIIVVSEHEASKMEQLKGAKAGDYPFAVIHLRFVARDGSFTGEVFPAVKLAVTPDGFLDVQTDSSNKIAMTNIARK
jgi:hypothetical protein